MGETQQEREQAALAFRSANWLAEPLPTPQVHPAAANFAERRKNLSAQFPGQTLVIPSGVFRDRTRSSEFPFRVNNDFYYLTGYRQPGAAFVLTPTAKGHSATLYVQPRLEATSEDYFSYPHGEMWTGPQPGLDEIAQRLQVKTASIEKLPAMLDCLHRDRTLFETDIDADMERGFRSNSKNDQLVKALARMRLVKDEWEITALQSAIRSTHHGLNRVMENLPTVEKEGERRAEVEFDAVARLEGNGVGFDTISASGADATTLHWTRNDGRVRSGELLLVDCGVEGSDLYTADVTRTVPVSGAFSKEQREIYEVVLAANQAGIRAVQPGDDFVAASRVAQQVLGAGLRRLGIPSTAVEKIVADNNLFVPRYMPHGSGHHLGLDVHDGEPIHSEIRASKLEPGNVVDGRAWPLLQAQRRIGAGEISRDRRTHRRRRTGDPDRPPGADFGHPQVGCRRREVGPAGPGSGIVLLTSLRRRNNLVGGEFYR